MEKKRKVSRPIWVLGLLIILLLGVVNVLAANTKLGERPNDTVPPRLLETGWTMLTKYGAAPVNLPTEIKTDSPRVTISRVMPPETGMIMKMPSNRQGVEVYINDRLVYQLNTTKLSRMVMVKNNVMVTLPSGGDPYTLTIVFSNLSGGVCRLPYVMYGDHHAVLMDVMSDQAVTIVSVIILFVLMVFMLVMIGYFLTKRRINSQLISLACFLVVLIGWTLTDSPLAAAMSLPLEYCGLICFYCLMLLPQTIVFFTIATLKKHHRSLNFVAGLIFVNMLVQGVLSLTGVARLNEMLYLTHGTLAITIVVGTYCVVMERREHPQDQEMFLFVGLNIMSAVGILSAVAYWLGLPEVYRMVMLLGTTFYFITQVIGVLSSFNRELEKSRVKITELEMFESFSHVDSLTGLGNRRSFEEKMDQIKAKLREDRDCLLFMLDLNGLKYTNDSFGHAAGDELIVSAANCIREAFGNGGDCYRIGGDEFAVLMPEAADPDHYVLRLNDAIRRANVGATVPLSIASGCSRLLQDDGKRKSMAVWKQEADVNMYLNKTEHRQETARHEEREMHDIIACVVAAVEARDRYTANHSGRVSEIAGLISERLGLSQMTVNMIREAALLHDIGKIAVPDEILRKPARLTDEEYKAIQRHAAMGGEIIGTAKSMDEIAAIVTHHHERFDGKGYPDGISGNNIPIGARIIAVADSIDAMTSERSYRHALSIDACRSEIEAEMGQAYDPAVSRIVLNNWEDIADIVRRHSTYANPY